jgi:hypothetical protein
MKKSRYLAMAAMVTLLVFAASAEAQVELRFTPTDQHIDVDESGSLSVMLDEVLDFRTIELWISYDPALVVSQGGQPGQLFSDSGCQLFPFFEEDEPGSWYGGSVIMGFDCYSTGPGELYRWDFTGLAEGICPVQVDSVAFFDPQAQLIEDVTLADTTILVAMLSSVDVPSVQEFALGLAPNPFNPRTTVQFGGPADEKVTVEVFDLMGSRVATLWQGILGPEPGAVQWNGTDQQGRSVSGGAYLFRIFGKGGQQAIRKGILLK